MKKILFIFAGSSALTTVVIDFLFHYLFTQPMETFVYFVVKFILAFTLSLVALNNYSYVKSLVNTLIFTMIFVLYYRLIELITKIGYGVRVPDIVFGKTTVTFQDNVLQSVFLWFIVHAFAFLFPVLVFGEMSKYIRDK